ncbi:MAG: hypothetical protein H7258_03255 [Ferruginibacter sp.]|nr:hypothetical protein [Ferruginibacter sp.]
MKKQHTNNLTTAGTHLKSVRKNTVAKTTSRYTYTEADLGEGILYVGLNGRVLAKQLPMLSGKDYSRSYSY